MWIKNGFELYKTGRLIAWQRTAKIRHVRQKARMCALVHTGERKSVLGEENPFMVSLSNHQPSSTNSTQPL